MDSIQKRRSIRKYEDRQIEKSDIEEIIKAGMLAPSAKNRQPWKYIVYCGSTKEELLDIMENGLIREERIEASLPLSKNGLPDAFHTLKIMRQAPVLIIILNTNGVSIFEKISVDERVTEICDSLSIGASVENMLLRATELGIGSLWIANTCFAYKELVEYIGTEHQLVGAVALGYADEFPNARPRKELEEVVEFRE
ncbi:MAG: nitroreductase family protein [Lachnospiraceae bacterium]|nr:nitroreductase family protein [Lachnospiraceae bacterium]